MRSKTCSTFTSVSATALSDAVTSTNTASNIQSQRQPYQHQRQWRHAQRLHLMCLSCSNVGISNALHLVLQRQRECGESVRIQQISCIQRQRRRGMRQRSSNLLSLSFGNSDSTVSVIRSAIFVSDSGNVDAASPSFQLRSISSIGATFANSSSISL
jgi:hypothetical protein